MFVRIELALYVLLSVSSYSNAQLNVGHLIETFELAGHVLSTSNDSNHHDSLDCPVISTTLGDLSGIRQDTIFGNNTFCSYRGIRYAEAPVEDLRFKAPVKSGKWNGTFNASSYGAACFQDKSSAYPNVSEDCLFLNVFVPNPKICSTSNDIVVIVFIHGGGYTSGAANDDMFGPYLLMNDCVILVTLNYRLAIFGFLPLALSEYSGNMGLKDQQLALEWVNEHISAFGGNPNKVTLMGHSAGSASVSFQRLNGKSRGLFKQAYAMSSASLSYYALAESNNRTDLIVEIAREELVFISNTDELIEYIKNADASHLLKRTQNVAPPGLVFESAWQPCIELETANNPFITQEPEIILARGGITIPTIYSYTSLEYMAFSVPILAVPDSISYLNLNFSFKLPFHGLDQNACKEEVKPLLDDIREFYFGDEIIDGAQIVPYMQLASYLNLKYSIEKEVAIQAQNGGDVRLLRADQRTLLNHLLQLNLPGVAAVAGVGHGEDLCNYFWCSVVSNYLDTYDKINLQKSLTHKVSLKVSKIFREILVNFAKYGNPISQIASNDSLVSATGTDALTALPFTEFLSVGTLGSSLNPDHEEFLFWLNLDERVQEIKKMSCNQK